MTLDPRFDPYSDFNAELMFETEFSARSQIAGAQGAQGAIGRQGGQGPTGQRGKDATMPSGALAVAAVSDNESENGTIYFSVQYQKLVFKDYQGRIYLLTAEQPIGQVSEGGETGPQS